MQDKNYSLPIQFYQFANALETSFAIFQQGSSHRQAMVSKRRGGGVGLHIQHFDVTLFHCITSESLII